VGGWPLHGHQTIDEFVENDAIFTKPGEIGVDYAQGYWNGPPVPWALAEHVMTGISPIASQGA